MPLQGKTRQIDRLKRYLDEFGSITALQALRDLAIMRLGARIWEMEQNGYRGRIQHDTVEVQNRWGQPCHVTRYTLIRKQQTELGL